MDMSKFQSTGQFIEYIAHEIDSTNGIKEKEIDLFSSKFNKDLFHCELFRINSFKVIDYESCQLHAHTSAADFYKTHIWSTTMARAGFYYDSNDQQTVCFDCKLSRNISFWTKDKNVFKYHKHNSPDCKFINNMLSGDIPLRKKLIEEKNIANHQFNKNTKKPAILKLQSMPNTYERNEKEHHPVQSIFKRKHEVIDSSNRSKDDLQNFDFDQHFFLSIFIVQLLIVIILIHCMKRN